SSSNADLSNVTVSQGTLSPTFSSGTTSYTVDVANAVNSLEITPTVADSTATVQVNGEDATSGVAKTVALSVGSNPIQITVTAQGGTTVRTYSVTVNRAGSSNANLSNLTLSAGTLTPIFTSGTTSYTANVAYRVDKVAVTPTVAESHATVTVNGTVLTSGSAMIPLGVGSNPITVVITAQDGSTNIYTITVTRSRAVIPPPVIPVTGVSLDQNSLKLSLGNPGVSLHAVVTPANATDQQVRWSSSNPAVATVDQNGLVQPVSSGQATITVSTVDGYFTASCSVIIEEVKLVGLKVSDSSFRLKPKRTQKIAVYAVYSDGEEKEITLNKKTVYKTSSSSIVTIKAGTLKAGNKEGEAIITVSFEDQTTSIDVTVSNAYVKELSLTPDALSLETEETKQVVATAKLSNKKTEVITEKAEWSSDDTSVVSVDEGKITAVAPGKATITVAYGGKTAQLKVEVTEGKVLQRLGASKKGVKLSAGKQQQIQLTAYYRDKTKAVITDKAEWLTSDEQVVTVQDGLITAVAPGNATIEASYRGKKVSIKITVSE
ncbi:MAG: cadherin-like beta sandwich domain-containing protein, partial [Clostridia bacterium]